MPKVELVFFRGCPNIDRARSVLRASGVTDFFEVIQDDLPAGHPYLRCSSPTIFRDGQILAGSQDGTSSCSIIDWQHVSKLIGS